MLIEEYHNYSSYTLWCKIYNIDYNTAWKKSKKGYSIEKILKLDETK